MPNLFMSSVGFIFEVYLFAFAKITRINTPAWFPQADRLNSNYANAIIVISISQIYYIYYICSVIFRIQNFDSTIEKIIAAFLYLVLLLFNKIILINKGYGIIYIRTLDNIDQRKAIFLSIIGMFIFLTGMFFALEASGKS
jgi:hypothetical protein